MVASSLFLIRFYDTVCITETNPDQNKHLTTVYDLNMLKVMVFLPSGYFGVFIYTNDKIITKRILPFIVFSTSN